MPAQPSPPRAIFVPRTKVAWVRLALVGSLPALALAAIALLSLGRQQQWALMEARQSAEDAAARLAPALAMALLQVPLPSLADLEAFDRTPGAPGDLPHLQAARHGWAHFRADALPTSSPSDGSAFFPERLPPPLAESWRQAEAPSLGPSEQEQRWGELISQLAPGTARANATFRRGRALMALGRTAEAARQFRAVMQSPGQPSVTGLPLELLALRSLLQVHEVDAASVPDALTLLDRLAHLVWFQQNLPPELLDEWQERFPARLAAWRTAATEFRRQQAFPFPEAAGTDGFWFVHGGEPCFITEHPVPGGRWKLARSMPALQELVDRAALQTGLPADLALHLRLGAREFSFPAETPPADALAAVSLSEVRDARLVVQLRSPEAFARRIQRRTVGYGAIVLAVTGLAVAGIIATARAYDRQRRLAELQAGFVASVSHELRAPLGAVWILADELADPAPVEPERVHQYATMIQRQVRRLRFLVENLLTQARLEHPSGVDAAEEVDVRELVEGAVADLQPNAAEREVRLDTRLPDTPLLIAVHRHAFQQVLQNLLDNAIKHSPAQSEVLTTVEAVPRGRAAVARIVVADRGPGIPLEAQERIFDAFYRRGSELRRETPGVGLGLALVRRMVEAHGGTVTVDSRPGEGARFILELPVAEPAAQDSFVA